MGQSKKDKMKRERDKLLGKMKRDREKGIN